MANKRSGWMPSRDSIAAYWSKQSILGEQCEPFPSDRCWRCDKKFYSWRTEEGGDEGNRCHIVPACLGGSNEVSNLVLLCSRCHAEAPDVKDKEFMWKWITATTLKAQLRLYADMMHAYEILFGPFPIPQMAKAFLSFDDRASLFPDDPGAPAHEQSLIIEHFLLQLKGTMKRVAYHGNPAVSYAWAVHQTIVQITSSEFDRN